MLVFAKIANFYSKVSNVLFLITITRKNYSPMPNCIGWGCKFHYWSNFTTHFIHFYKSPRPSAYLKGFRQISPTYPCY